MKHTLIFTLITFVMLTFLSNSFAQDTSPPERMVRMIYFLPNDRAYRPEVVQNMKDMIRRLQTFFEEQMQAHGYGEKTFRFETDAKGEPKVHRLDGLHSDRYYLDNLGYWLEVDQKFDRFGKNVYFLVWDNSTNTITSGVGGTGGGNKRNGQLAVPARFSFGLVAHELAHAFGLGHHDFRDGKYILSYGPGQNQLSACAAEFLAVHPYFNANVPIEDGTAPTIELMSPRTYPAGSEGVTIQLKVSDPDGVHQVLLSGIGNLIACRGLKGEKEAIVEFEYKGYHISPNDIVSISDAVSHSITAQAVDTNADTRWIEFNLAEISPHHIHTFGDHTNAVHSLAFSPDSKKIASGGWDVAKLWDVATQQNIATFEGGVSVVFSPNGRILATAGGNNVNLWDVATQRNIATFLEHIGHVYSLAFSPDGKMLASGTDEIIKLWDVATQRNIATFTAHKRPSEFTPVQTLAFSPDGTLLASGTLDRIIKLWDVATRNNIASIRVREDKLAPHIHSLAFSPDGTLLASGIGNGPGSVELWDVSTKRNIASIDHPTSVNSVVFSPDGRIIASGSREGIATLRNVSTRKKIVDFPHTYNVRSVAFSPDGRLLASGTEDGKVHLFDVTSFHVLTPPTARLSFNPPTIADQTFTVREAVNLTLPVATGGTPPYTYTLTPLPEGLSFDTTTRELSGTPTTAETTTATYTATDAANMSASLTFTIEVTAGVILDVNGDGQVTVIDLAIVALFYGTQVPADTRLPADVNADGVVDILDLTAVAQGIDAASSGNGLSLQAVEAALLAAAEQAADIEVIAEAPNALSGGNLTYRNVAAALADARLDKQIPETVLKELLHLLTERVAIPEQTALLPNYPNPFNPETWLPYQLATPASVTLSIYSVEGRLVRTLDVGYQPAGIYRSKHRAAYWDGRNDIGEPVASGLYFYTLRTSDFAATRKLIIRK